MPFVMLDGRFPREWTLLLSYRLTTTAGNLLFAGSESAVSLLHILIPQKASSQQSSSGDTTKVTSTPGETVHQALRTASLKNHPAFSQHLRIMLFSEALLKDNIPLDALMNQFIVITLQLLLVPLSLINWFINASSGMLSFNSASENSMIRKCWENAG